MQKNNDPGFVAGVIYACGLLAQMGADDYAEHVFNESGFKKEACKEVAEYDVALLRRVIPDLPKSRK